MKHIKLNNGIDITISPIKNKSVFYISYTILHGYLHELEGNFDYTHLVEHILASFVHKSICKKEKIKEMLSNYIYTSNAYTSETEMGVWIEGKPENIEFYIKLLSNSLFDLCFHKKDLEIHKENVIQELKQDDDTFHYVAFNTYFRKRNVDNKISIRDMQNISIDKITQYYQMLLSQHIVISIACNNLYMKNISTILQKYFDKQRTLCLSGNPISQIIYPIKNKIIKCYKPIETIECKICIQIQNIQIYSIKYVALQIFLNYIFDFDEGIMYQKLRHQYGFIYSINWNLNMDRINHKDNILTITTFFDKKNKNKVLNIFDNIKNNITITKKQFDIFKKQLLFNLSYDSMNNINSYTNYYSKQYLYNEKIITYKQYLELYTRVQYTDMEDIHYQFKNNIMTTFLYNQKY